MIERLTVRNRARRGVYHLHGPLSNHAPVFAELEYHTVGPYPVWYRTLTSPPSQASTPRIGDGQVGVIGGD